jgi:hypothetical protein
MDGKILILSFMLLFLDTLIPLKTHFIDIVDAVDRLGKRISGLFWVTLVENGYEFKLLVQF